VAALAGKSLLQHRDNRRYNAARKTAVQASRSEILTG
jgi:hypothetical protein